jgi:hypothetical protein
MEEPTMDKNQERLIRLKRYRSLDKAVKRELALLGRVALDGGRISQSTRRRVRRIDEIRDAAFDHLREL